MTAGDKDGLLQQLRMRSKFISGHPGWAVLSPSPPLFFSFLRPLKIGWLVDSNSAICFCTFVFFVFVFVALASSESVGC